MKREKNSFALKMFFSLLALVLSWFSIGIGFSTPIHPQLNGLLFIGGLLAFFVSAAALIYFFIRQIQS